MVKWVDRLGPLWAIVGLLGGIRRFGRWCFCWSSEREVSVGVGVFADCVVCNSCKCSDTCCFGLVGEGDCGLVKLAVLFLVFVVE
ncbi:hypothetical protein HanRHA438_Chr07g0317941 [Helianthus annuus]|nr:hypothetical protein HanHA300_Chr07g0254671 [Helianthus annuus]KAJ0564187.1 hypothetical protein HanHA89_Chr07g0271471 [Helianthus annuus]KAJ0732243.1 hypothetical protein HanOQP8_Chr07g0261011 [Helianthus annuus]KAJ0905861.1 hypothetical protein HanPSC8_Chr07g0298911 [Helianthus annuus]KAJ0909111.1 hypothetical protein HanRHA438_Chr07g0317941 [Helianthus annuus]